MFRTGMHEAEGNLEATQHNSLILQVRKRVKASRAAPVLSCLMFLGGKRLLQVPKPAGLSSVNEGCIGQREKSHEDF